MSLPNERKAAIGRLLLPPDETGAKAMPIRHYLDDNTVFEPDAITAMSEALERACAALHVNGHAHDREVIAERIIALARHGVTDAKALGDRVIAEVEAMRAL